MIYFRGGSVWPHRSHPIKTITRDTCMLTYSATKICFILFIIRHAKIEIFLKISQNTHLKLPVMQCFGAPGETRSFETETKL